MEKALLEVIQEYKDRCNRMFLNRVEYLIPVGIPALVSYGGVYRSLPPGAKWIPGIVIGHWGDRVVDTKVKVNAMAWYENCLYHRCNLHYRTPTDPSLEIVVKVSSSCVQPDRTLVCLLSDKPHHPDFVGNAVPASFLREKLFEYNTTLRKQKNV